MVIGQILVYRFNGLHNARPNVPRDQFSLRDVEDKTRFKDMVHDALDEVPPGRGYVLIKWSGKIFIAEKDVNDPDKDYVRHEVKYQPLAGKFTI